MRFSRIFSDILPESNIFATHMVRRFGGIGRKVVNFKFHIYSFADTSWSDDKYSRKSTCCYLVFVHNAAFSWRSFMSPIVSIFTSETELVGACAQEIQFCRNLAAELRFRQYAPTPLFEDNMGVYRSRKAWEFCIKSKHIHLRWMFMSEFIRDGILQLHQVPTTQQVADISPKFLPWSLF
jgi:hypothetical protein